MPRTRVSLLVAVLALALSAAPAWAGSITSITAGNSPGEVSFAQPTNDADSRDWTIITDLENHIRSVPCGSTIRGAIHSMSGVGETIKNLLVEKKNCGSDVKIVHNGEVPRSATSQALADGLGPTRFKWCDHGVGGAWGWGCVSTHSSGRMHSKFFLFSRDGGRSCVSWIGSPNLTVSTGTSTSNNAVAVFDNCELHDRLRDKIWTPMWGQFAPPNNDFYNPGAQQGFFSAPTAAASVHASPEQDTDLVLSRLASMTSGPGCTVGVSEAMWTEHRQAIADRLAQLKSGPGGCTINVIVGKMDNGGANIHFFVYAALTNANIKVRYGKVHDKYILMHSAGRPYTVITGSHNLSLPALKHNDELLLDITSSPSLYNAFLGHWAVTWGNATALN